jgi:hypothetical protein
MHCRGILTECLADPVEFDHVQPPLAGLDAPYKGMLTTQIVGKVPLCHSGPPTHFHQLVQHAPVLRTVDGLSHAGPYTPDAQEAAKCGQSALDRILRARYKCDQWGHRAKG